MSSGLKPIVVVGSINIDLVTSADRIPVAGETLLGKKFRIHPGGKGANQAAAVARLGYPVQMIGCVGMDSFGATLRSDLESAGVDTSGVLNRGESSGVAVIVVSESGENLILVTPGANHMLRPEDLDAKIAQIRNAGIVLTQLEIPLETVEHLSAICAREDVPLMLDPAPATAVPAEIWRRIQWITPNQTEAEFYLDGELSVVAKVDPQAIATSILSKGPAGVVLKMSGEGAYVALRSGSRQRVPAFRVAPVDTTAAGDAFNGGFATGLMLDKSPYESARFASAVAAISVTRPGAQSSMPTREEVEELLRNTDDPTGQTVNEKWAALYDNGLDV